MLAGAWPVVAEVPAGSGEFAACIAGLQARALGEGISEPVVRDVLGKASRLERVVELDRKQPEFTATFADYLTRRVTEERVARGRALLEKHADLLADAERRYGVPAHYLLAFWGLETNFGAYFGSVPVTDSLATLACDPRRSDFFAAELITALRIVDAGDIAPARMIGSWAGAMGHMQFLPSVFTRFAVDGDGDGKRDVWGSLPDVFASAGNFLRALGWSAGVRWGREALLPSSFDYAEAGPDESRPLSEWAAFGVTDAFGKPLPAIDLPASILVPAGHEGPAFLVYGNFGVIMGWNRSEFYALTVGHLADRIAGAAPLQREPQTDGPRVTIDEVRQLQADLASLGYEAGEPDGIPGPATRKAVRRFQADRRLLADGFVDPEIVAAVRDAVAGSTGT
jgi:membrane-bound lytic murein transglycosylase B